MTDAFGLIAQGYCTYSYTVPVLFHYIRGIDDEITLTELDDSSFVSVEGDDLVLVTPNSQALVQTWQAELTVHFLDSTVVVPPIQFEVDVQTPDCSDLRLETVEPLVDMLIDFGSAQLVGQDVPQIADSFGLLSMDFCQLSFAVVLDQATPSAGRLL